MPSAIGCGGPRPARWRISAMGCRRASSLARDRGRRSDRSSIQADAARGDGVVERLLVERLVLREGVDPAEHELITAGRRLRHARGTGHAAGTADVLDDHLLTEYLGEARGEHC